MELKGIDCLVYLDDIICISASMTQNVEKLCAIVERLDRANLRYIRRIVFLLQILSNN